MPDDVPATTFRLIYRSRDLIPPEGRKKELGSLFGVARFQNKERHVCGALLLSEETFVQVLEGEESVVRDLFAHIEKDSRHDSVTVLESGVVAAPAFSRWAMAKVAEDGDRTSR